MKILKNFKRLFLLLTVVSVLNCSCADILQILLAPPQNQQQNNQNQNKNNQNNTKKDQGKKQGKTEGKTDQKK